jgi:hypothetical protein
MFASRIRAVVVAAGASLGLAACTTSPFGYSGVSVGVGSNGYYGSPYYGYGYGSPYYGYGSRYSGYGYPGYGWYNGYYYPGSGYYVYGRDGSRYRWSDSQRRYWEARRAEMRQNRALIEAEQREFRHDRRVNRRAYRDGEITREEQQERNRAERREYRRDTREARRELRRERRRDD